MAERWSDYEIEYLMANAGEKDPEQIGDILGRTKMGVINYARKKKISLAVWRERWSDEDDRILFDMKMKGHTSREIAEKIGRSKKAVEHRYSVIKQRHSPLAGE